ncbi:dolichyl-P-Man:GDP-Man5GlcNAc2-PP-dolichyl alpha-1,2-mannosyltransferase [Novymonas esmeraldas]|uniref:Mannosyltransferase n=1 Tax=Novymonas esmeraldas TaxID=1808958 RepID=A0AAW0EXV0_9TRYP
MFRRAGYYLQMVAAFLLLALTHYFASSFLPIADCDETFNFIEPIHYLLYGSGKQTWELCRQFALRSWLFSWMYAWPAVFIRGAASLSSADVYFYLRIFNGRIAALAELFFVYSVWAAFSGKTAMVALLLLLVNYPIPHAAASVLPTSFVMICNFVVLGCWLRTESWTAAAAASAAAPSALSRARLARYDTHTRAPRVAPAPAPPPHLAWCVNVALFLCVLGVVAGWPFAGLVAAPVGLDLLLRFPARAVASTAASLAVVGTAALLMDARYYCRWTLSSLNVVVYNVFGGPGRGPELFDVEPWYFFYKNLALNFHLLFLAAMLAPVVVLCAPRRQPAVTRAWVAEDGAAVGLGEGPVSPTHPLARSRLRAPSMHGPASAPHSPLVAPRHGCAHTSAAAAAAAAPVGGCSRGRELLFMSPFFLWFTFWMSVAHKEERFMAPAHPFMVLAATRALCLVFFPDAPADTPPPPPSPSPPPAATAAAAPHAVIFSARADADYSTSQQQEQQQQPSVELLPCRVWWSSPAAVACRRVAGLAFLVAFALLSCSRAMAIYFFYSGPERLLYHWYPVLQAEAQRTWEAKRLAAAEGGPLTTGTTAQQTEELRAYHAVCLGREWYRFPSSFFLNHRWARYHFVADPHFSGMLPISFAAPPPGEERGFLHAPAAGSAVTATRGGSCTCGAPGVNDLNRAIPEQYVRDPADQCDVIFDSLSPPSHVGAAQHAEERRQRLLDTVFTRSLLNVSALRAALEASGEPYRAVESAYAVLDVDRTPLWCRVLYYPLGVSQRCAVWRPLVLHARPIPTTP